MPVRKVKVKSLKLSFEEVSFEQWFEDELLLCLGLGSGGNEFHGRGAMVKKALSL